MGYGHSLLNVIGVETDAVLAGAGGSWGLACLAAVLCCPVGGFA